MPDKLGYMVNDLDRAGVENEHDAFLSGAADPETLSVVIAGDIPILRVVGEAIEAAFPLGLLPQPAVPVQQVMLGRLEGRTVLGTLFDAAVAERLKEQPGFRVQDLRSLAVHRVLPPGRLGMLAQAKSLLHWHTTHPFCSRCGGATTAAQAGLRRDCPACGGQHFPRTDPVSIMLIVRGDACLLGRQTRFLPGMYSCLAGFISPGETLEDAVRREVKEEAGIRVGEVRYVASQPWPFPSSLMIGCRGEALDDTITLDRDELEDGRWFGRDEVRRMLARDHPDGLQAPVDMAIANLLLRAFVAEG